MRTNILKRRKQFVQIVRKYPVIYDKRFQQRNFDEERRVTWKRIALEINTSVEYCQNEWKFLEKGYHSKRISQELLRRLSFLGSPSSNDAPKFSSLVRPNQQTIVTNLNAYELFEHLGEKHHFTTGRSDNIQEAPYKEKDIMDDPNGYFFFLRYIHSISHKFPPLLINKIKQKIYEVIIAAERELMEA